MKYKDFYPDLINEHMSSIISKEKISNIIKKCKMNSFGGNCGIFAIGLAEALKDIGITDVILRIFCSDEGENVEDYYNSELDIYHVILDVRDSNIDDFFDGDGIVEENKLDEILSEYEESLDTCRSLNLELNEKNKRFIRSNTAFTEFDDSDFYHYFKKHLTPKKSNRTVDSLKEINIRKKGSCMYYAEKVNDALMKKGISGYKVVEGYVRFKKNGGKSFTPNFQHTWIEMNDGRIIDKTKAQFSEYDTSTIQYMLNGRKEYSPEEYKKLCIAHPVDMEGNSVIKESVSGFDRPAYWFYEDFGMNIGVELRGDSSDKIRISAANSAKTSRIIPWIDKVKQELIKLKYSPIKVDVIFTSRKIVPTTKKIKKDDLVDVGYAVIENDGRYYFLLNIDYLSGRKNLNSALAIFGFIHEWSHIWLFLNETHERDDMLKNILMHIRDDRKLMPFGSDEEYALSDDDGDELWAYMNTHYEKLNPIIKKIFWKIRMIDISTKL